MIDRINQLILSRWNKVMTTRIRQVTAAEYFQTEVLTREAFWNIYKPGADEHLVLHRLRQSSGYLPELDLVLEHEGQLIAHIIYAQGILSYQDERQEVFHSFGPVSVRPDYQRQGFGTRLISHSLEAAALLGCRAIYITGSPDYYTRFGFLPASGSNIKLSGVSDADPADYFMVKCLGGFRLDGQPGIFNLDGAYFVNPSDVEDFDSQFRV